MQEEIHTTVREFAINPIFFELFADLVESPFRVLVEQGSPASFTTAFFPGTSVDVFHQRGNCLRVCTAGSS